MAGPGPPRLRVLAHPPPEASWLLDFARHVNDIHPPAAQYTMDHGLATFAMATFGFAKVDITPGRMTVQVLSLASDELTEGTRSSVRSRAACAPDANPSA